MSPLRRALALAAVVTLGALVAPVAASGAEGGVTVSAHRGGRALWPENSMLAYRSAIDSGVVDEVEADTRVTEDGVYVMFHDASVPARCDRFVGAAVWTLTAAEVATIRCDGQPVPTLAAFLDLIVAHPRVDLAIEMKTDTGQGDASKERQLGELVRRVASAGLTDRTIVESFWWGAAEAAHRVLPAQRVALQIFRVPTLSQLADGRRRGAYAVSYGSRWSTTVMATYARSLGMPTITWTSNTRHQIWWTTAQGVTVPMTDDPLMAASALATDHRCIWWPTARSSVLLSTSRLTAPANRSTAGVSSTGASGPRERLRLKVTTTIPDLRIAPEGSPGRAPFEVPVARGTSTVTVLVSPSGRLRIRSASGATGSVTVTWVGADQLVCGASSIITAGR